MSPRRTDLFTTDATGQLYAARNGVVEFHTDDHACGWLAVATGDTASMIVHGFAAALGGIAAGRAACVPALPSARYVPTAEQRQADPLCAALAARGWTERDVIDFLLGRLRKEHGVRSGRDPEET